MLFKNQLENRNTCAFRILRGKEASENITVIAELLDRRSRAYLHGKIVQTAYQEPDVDRDNGFLCPIKITPNECQEYPRKMLGGSKVLFSCPEINYIKREGSVSMNSGFSKEVKWPHQ